MSRVKVKKDLTGLTFGQLTVIERADDKCYPSGESRANWRCQCSCGETVERVGKILVSKTNSTCNSCYKKMISTLFYKHGLTNTKIYTMWANMMSRCTNPKNTSYKNYGGRGIKVCDGFDNSLVFMEYCLLNGWKESLEIDRIDYNGNYEKSNIRFVMAHINATNQRVYKNNKSGYRGVHWHNRDKIWESTLRNNNKQIYLGRFDTKEGALDARNKYIKDNNLTEYEIQDYVRKIV